MKTLKKYKELIILIGMALLMLNIIVICISYTIKDLLNVGLLDIGVGLLLTVISCSIIVGIEDRGRK